MIDALWAAGLFALGVLAGMIAMAIFAAAGRADERQETLEEQARETHP